MAAPAYNLSNPQWDGHNSATTNVEWDKGYGVTAPMQKWKNQYHDSRNDLYNLANGQLNNGTVQWPLFITAVDIDFSVQGSVAQSRLTRDFYPHNFTQPAFRITGQALDEMDYGMMCEFVHMCQYSMIQDFSDSNLLQLQIAHRGIPGNLAWNPTELTNVINQLGKNHPLVQLALNNPKTITPLAVSVNGEPYYNASVHGPHQEIIAKGVVTTIPRQHEAGVPSQTWEFGFQVYEMIMGPYTEGQAALPETQATWVDMLTEAQQYAGLTTTNAAMLKQNAKVLKWAAANSVNVISSSDDG